jgi:hypothetical protein
MIEVGFFRVWLFRAAHRKKDQPQSRKGRQEILNFSALRLGVFAALSSGLRSRRAAPFLSQ